MARVPEMKLPREQLRHSLESSLSKRPMKTPKGAILKELRRCNFGYPGGAHEGTNCWVYSSKLGDLEMLFSFYSNFTRDDLIVKVIPAGRIIEDGEGATIQFNGERSLEPTHGSNIVLSHHGRVTVRTSVSRDRLVATMKSVATSGYLLLGGSSFGKGWPFIVGDTGNLKGLLDRLFLYAYCIEQAKRQFRGEPLLGSLKG